MAKISLRVSWAIDRWSDRVGYNFLSFYLSLSSSFIALHSLRAKCIFQRSIDRWWITKERKEQYDDEKFLIDDNSATKCLIAMHKLIASDHSIAQSDTEQQQQKKEDEVAVRGWAAQTQSIDGVESCCSIWQKLYKSIQHSLSAARRLPFLFYSESFSFSVVLVVTFASSQTEAGPWIERFQPLNLIEWAQVER